MIHNIQTLKFFPLYLSLTKNSFIAFSLKLCDVFIMIMPTIGYLDIIRIMITTRSPAAFNYNTCFILMSAHGLKILYRIFHPYAARIFGQSVSQFSVSFVMAYLKYHYSQNEKLQNQSSNGSSSGNFKEEKKEFPRKSISYYFKMAKTQTFSEFMASFFLYSIIILICFAFGYNFIDKKGTVDTIGVIANLIDSTISIPTFIKIVFHRDIINVSTVLILQFILGDMMKLALFILSKAPGSFVAGACLQLTLDTILFFNFLQLYFCSRNLDPEGEELINQNFYDMNDINIININDDENDDDDEKDKMIIKENRDLDDSLNEMSTENSNEI